MTPLDALTIGPHVVQVLRALVRSVSRKSAGGKRITPEEGRVIAGELRELGEAVLAALGIGPGAVDADLRAALAELRHEIGVDGESDVSVVRRATRLLRDTLPFTISAPVEPLTPPASVLDMERVV